MVGLAMTISSYFICIHVFVERRWFFHKALKPLRKYSLNRSFNSTRKQEEKIIKLLTLSPNSIVILFSIFQDVVCA